MAVSHGHQYAADQWQKHCAGSAHDVQRRTGRLHSGRIRRAAGRRHAYPGKRSGIIHASKPFDRRTFSKSLILSVSMKPIVFLTLFTLASAFAIKPPREAAPNFRARTMDGEKFSNESLKGKVVLLQFWATWCKVCRAD